MNDLEIKYFPAFIIVEEVNDEDVIKALSNSEIFEEIEELKANFERIKDNGDVHGGR